MKKAMWGIIILVFVVAMASAQTVTVTKPAAGETWIKGTTYTVTWTKNGTMPDLVRLSLRDPNTLAEVKLIQDNVTNTGTWPWTVPSGIVDGQYRLRVKVKNVAVQDDSDVFKIATTLKPGTITVTKPVSSDWWVRGQSYAINWNYTGDLSSPVVITLMNSIGTSFIKTIADPAPNTGSFQWTIPADTPEGQSLVRVKLKDANVQGDSKGFTLAAALPPNPISVTKPALNETWLKGQPYTVVWTCTGINPNQVGISLINPYTKALVKTIADPAPNTGSYPWTVAADIPANMSYSIRVKAVGMDVAGDSKSFFIKDPPPTGIIVTMPDKNSNWKSTGTYNITWTKNGTMPNTVKIMLADKYSVNVVRVLADDAPNSGSFSWTVPGDLALDQYHIWILVNTTQIFDESDLFNISLMIKMPKVIKK